MKHLLFLAFLSLVHTISIAQSNYQLTSGKQYHVLKRTYQPTLIAADETGYFVESKDVLDPDDVRLERYDKDLNFKVSKKILFEKNKDNWKYECFFYSNNTIYILTSFRDYKGNKRILYAQTVNKETMELNDDMRVIKECDDFPYLLAKYVLRTSPDGSKLLVYTDYPVDKKDKKSDRYIFDVFEGDMKTVWSKEIKLPYEDELFSIQSYDVDNEGRLFFLGALFEGMSYDLEEKEYPAIGLYSFGQLLKGAESKKKPFKYILITYNGTETSGEQFEISLKDKFISDISLNFDRTGDLICSGFYSKTGVKHIGGAYYQRYDGKSKELKKEVLKNFAMDFITFEYNSWQMDAVEKLKKEGKEPEMENYGLASTTILDDGSIVMLAEYNPNYSHSLDRFFGAGFSSGLGRRAMTGYSFKPEILTNPVLRNDLLIVKIDPAGEISMMDRIVKRQLSLYFYSSIGVASNGQDVYLLYNDHAANYGPKAKKTRVIYKEKKVSSKTVLVIAKIDKDGKITKEPFVNAKAIKSICKPKDCVQLPGNKIFIPSEKGFMQQLNVLLLK